MCLHSQANIIYIYIYISCDRLQENRAQRGMRKYREKIDRFLKNVLFQDDGRKRKVYYSGNDLESSISVSAKNFFEGCRVVPGFPVDGQINIYIICMYSCNVL